MRYEEQSFENLTGQESVEDTDYSDCIFHGCDFVQTKIKYCSFDNCEFIDCTFSSVEFAFCTMRNCTFSNCSLIGINWSGLVEHGSIFFAARSLKKCIIKSNDFFHLTLPACDFSDSTIQDTYFEECDLRKADFRKVNFSRAIFDNCDLREADFREAKNYLIDTNNNKIKGAKFSYPDVVGLLAPLGIKIEDL